MNTQSIDVLAAPLFDPGAGRVTMTMHQGLTVDEIIVAALPSSSEQERRQMRVALVTDRGVTLIDRHYWARVRPKAGVRIVIRVIPGGSSLRSILSIVVSIAAVALGQFWAGAGLLGLTGAAGNVAAGLIGLGVSRVGCLQVNFRDCRRIGALQAR